MNNSDCISSIIGGMALREPGHADQESGSAGAPSGAGRTVHVRLKPHLPRIFELIPVIHLLRKIWIHEDSRAR